MSSTTISHKLTEGSKISAKKNAACQRVTLQNESMGKNYTKWNLKKQKMWLWKWLPLSCPVIYSNSPSPKFRCLSQPGLETLNTYAQLVVKTAGSQWPLKFSILALMSLNRVATVYCTEGMYLSIPITAGRYLKQLAVDRITRWLLISAGALRQLGVSTVYRKQDCPLKSRWCNSITCSGYWWAMGLSGVGKSQMSQLI